MNEQKAYRAMCSLCPWSTPWQVGPSEPEALAFAVWWRTQHTRQHLNAKVEPCKGPVFIAVSVKEWSYEENKWRVMKESEL